MVMICHFFLLSEGENPTLFLSQGLELPNLKMLSPSLSVSSRIYRLQVLPGLFPGLELWDL